MRDLDLLEQYLIRLRQDRLQQGHEYALESPANLTRIVVCAHEAELIDRVRAALQELAKDPGEFIKRNLT